MFNAVSGYARGTIVSVVMMSAAETIFFFYIFFLQKTRIGTKEEKKNLPPHSTSIFWSIDPIHVYLSPYLSTPFRKRANDLRRCNFLRIRMYNNSIIQSHRTIVHLYKYIYNI